MDDVERSFIEGVGLISEEDGMPRIAGQVFGLLILREDALSLDEIAAELQVSKASVSTNARLLNRMGVVERASRPGDRRDFYRITADAPERGLDGVMRRMVRMLELLDTTMERLPEGKGAEYGRLASMRDWHAFLLEEIRASIGRWQREHKGSKSGSGESG